MTLRAGRPPRASADALARLHAAAFAQTGRAWSPTELEFLSRDEAATWIEAERAGRLSGFAVLRRALDEVEVLTLCRDPEFAGAKIGDALIGAALDWAAEAGVEAVFLEVADDNRAALELYRRAGFEQVGVRSRYYRLPDGLSRDALVLRNRPPLR